MPISARPYTTSNRCLLLARLLPIVLFSIFGGPLVHSQSSSIALVQHAGKDAGTTTSSTLAFAANNTAGNWIAVVIRAGVAGQVFTVTDTRGNTYRKAIQFNETVDATTLGLFYAENIAGGANTITVSDTIGGGTLRFAIFEYAGVATANSLDVVATAQGNSNAPATPAVTTTVNGDLVIGVLSTANTRTFTAGSGFVIQERVPAPPNTKLAVEDRRQATAGPVSANGTLNSSDLWGAALAAFRPATGGSPAPSVTSVNPASGTVGTTVTISGANFGATQGTSTVTFNGTAATPTSWSASSLIAPVPAGATTGPVVVTVNGAASNGMAFTVTTSGVDTQPPTAPGNLTATAVGGSRIDLNWTAATDNVGVVEYRIEQCQGTGCANFTQIATVGPAPPAISAPLTVSANPNYFQDGSGVPLILNGSHAWNNLQDWGTNGTLQALDFTAYVNTLVAHGHNFTLLWYVETPRFCGLPTTAGTPPDFIVGPHPWLRTGPGVATDGGPKFDLTAYNLAYFDRLRTRVEALRNAGIYVGVYLFTAEWVGRYRCSTDGYPFTGANNINGVDDGGGSNSFTMSAPNAITAIQDAYVEKVIDTLNDLPNVLWMVSEEAPSNSQWWNSHQIAHVRAYESGKPFRHPIGYAAQAELDDTMIVNSDADWIAGAARISPVTSCGSGAPRCKVNVNDSDHSYFGMWNDSAQANRNYAWQNFTNGNQVVFMDPYVVSYPRESRNLCTVPTDGICSGPDPRWTNFRNTLGDILRYSRKLNLANVTPRSALCSTSNCLAQTPSVGAEYLVYAPNGGSFTVNLSAMSSARTLNVEWFNPSSRATIAAGPIAAGSAAQSFTPPFSGDAVLYLVDSAGHAGSGATPPASYSVTGLPPGTYGYRVRAADSAGNVGPFSNVASAALQAADVTPPSVSVTAPAANATVTGTAVAVSATASDNVGVAGVQFLLDGAPLGTEDTTAPYSIAWNTTTTTSTVHAVAARARDLSGNTATGAANNVTVDNQAPTGTVLINGGAAATNSRSATLTLSATDPGGVAQMRFSDTGTSFSAAEAYATTKAWTLTAGAGTKTVYVQFRDTIGNWSASVTDTITLDTTAPNISAVSSSNISSSAATISWATNEPATSQVEYGRTTSYGTLTPVDTNLLTSHGVVVTGLAPQAAYNYRVRSRDAAGNERIGANGTFTTTAGPDTVPPATPTGLAAAVISPTQINLAWNAATDNVGVTGYLVYRDTIQVAAPATTSFQDTGLSRGTTYSYSVAARDAAGNVSPVSPPVTAATPAFVITNVQSSGITSSRATISWTTDQPTDSQVEYGLTSAYGQITVLDPALSTNHSQMLTGLSQNTTYHFRVRSTDSAARLLTSTDFTFTTAPAGATGVFQNEILISGMNLPTALYFLPNGDMLVLELGGNIWSVPAGTTQVRSTPFLSLTNVGSLNGQQGLMGMVLDPDFPDNRYYYVFYTLGSPNRDRVSRFTATADYLGTVPGTELVLYQDPQNAHAEHHGGALNFGNDGKLYITTGEHFDPPAAQSLTSPRGKILRINKDGTIPTDNPFFDGAGPNRDDIWARGLRNPFRAFYDRMSGKLYVGDVGGNDYSTAQEEVNLGVAGANYGWPNCEGSSCGTNPAYTSPIYSYPHNGRDASITGGFIYRGSQFPAQYYGNYFFADYAQNWIRRLTFDASGNVAGVFNFEPIDGSADGPYGDIVYLTEGPDGALYYVDLGYSDTTGQSGISKIRRIRFIPDNLPPIAVIAAQPTNGSAPLTVNFSSAGSTDPENQPLAYLWSFGDGATSTAPNPVHTYTARGPFTVRLTVSDGEVDTVSDPMLIEVGNRPVVDILSPADGFLFRGGDAIQISGDATDLEDGVLAASAFTWTIDFLHAGHIHPGLPTTGTKFFIFDIPAAGHDFSGDTRYRITLTVTDADGLHATRSVIIYPDKVNLSFSSVPSGLAITIDGLARTTPFVYDTLINFWHTIEAPNQIVGQTQYTFGSWSDGGTQQHTITVPAAAQSYTATFSSGPAPFPPGLVAGYRLDEGSSTTTADISGNAISGTLVNAPVWTTGKYGGALSFGGTSYVNLGNPVPLRLTGSMTLSAWINISANPADDGAIVAKLGPAGWQLKTSPDTGVRTAAIQISSNGSDSIQRYSATVLAPNTWYHVAGVYNAAARTLNIYVNGVLDNGVLSGIVPASQFNSTFNVNIAQRTGNPGTYNFRGRIDEVHIFNRALTATEIQNDMTVPR